MKKCGIIGGISPEATVDYYKGIINGYRERIKDGSYPEIIIHSINMTKMIGFIQNGDRPGLVSYIASAVNSLKNGGADFALMSSNTPHIGFDEIEAASPIPLISIVRETCKAAETAGLKKCGLLGTSFTMTSGFYDSAFKMAGISVAVPDAGSQKIVHEIIFSELVFGRVTDESGKKLMDIINAMIKRDGIDSVILGCTELPLILKVNDSLLAKIPFLNTTAIHVKSIVDCITG